jgi:hypothetical protein
VKYILTLTPLDKSHPPMIYGADLPGEDLRTEEYALTVKAKCLYRDVMFTRGLWPVVPKA